MLGDLGALNWVAVLLATVAYFMFGIPWFSPMGFQAAWDRAIGFERPTGWKPSPPYYLVPFLGCLVMSLTTAVLLHGTDARSFADAIVLGLVVGVGYAAATTAVVSLTPTTPRPAVLAAVVGGYHVVGIVIAAVVITAMG